MIISDHLPPLIKISFNVCHHLEYKIQTLQSDMKNRASQNSSYPGSLLIFEMPY